MRPHDFFITGTDTEIGKTRVSCLLLAQLAARGISAIGMKPIAAGTELQAGRRVNDDVEKLVSVSRPAPRELINPYLFDEPIAPHIAAERSGRRIELDQIVECYRQLTTRAQSVIVEGVGGFCVPLGDDTDTAMLAQRLKLPVILVVGLRLGCINHALLSATSIAAHGLKLAGWVANSIDPNMLSREENIAALQQRLNAPLLGVVPYSPQATPLDHVDVIRLPGVGVGTAQEA